MITKKIKDVLEITRKKRPLVHCITNYVTVNDVANILLACGASPIMADDKKEAADITKICQATEINIGTLNSRTIESMLIAGQEANRLGHPVILDPVGAGASELRRETVNVLLETVKFTVIRGNISEIKTIAQGKKSGKGVDADIVDGITTENIEKVVSFVRKLAKETDAVIVVTGAIDLISSSDITYVCKNGHELMSSITGTGCMLSAVIAAFCAANPKYLLEATAAAVSAVGLCGELAWKKTFEAGEGTGSFRYRFMDAVSLLSVKTFTEGCRLEKYE